jgi:hypothetical protein
MDLDCEVEPVATSQPDELVSVRIVKGTLIVTRKYRREQTYNVENRSTKDRKVLVEHAHEADWTLVTPKEPTERTRDLYRFAMDVAAGKGQKLVVAEERQMDESVVLGNVPDDQIAVYLRARVVSDAVKEALQKLVDMKLALAQTMAERTRLETQVGEIHKEQERIRENMARLDRNSPLYSRYVKELTDQEDQLSQSRDKIEQLRDQEAKQRTALDEFLASIEVS